MREMKIEIDNDAYDNIVRRINDYATRIPFLKKEISKLSDENIIYKNSLLTSINANKHLIAKVKELKIEVGELLKQEQKNKEYKDEISEIFKL